MAVLCRVLKEWNGRREGDGVYLDDLEAIPLIKQGIVETYDGRKLEQPHNFTFIGKTQRR